MPAPLVSRHGLGLGPGPVARSLGWAALAALWLLGLLPMPAAAAARFDLDETYPLSAEGVIELRTRDADVVIVGTDRDDVRVTIHYQRATRGIAVGGDAFEVDVERTPDRLRILERPRRRSGVTVGVVRSSYQVRIEAPASVSLDVHGDDDDYQISGIHGAIALVAGDGRIRLSDCRGTEFDLTFEDGELEMDRGAGELRLEFDDGDAELRHAAFERVTVRANDGTLRMAGNLAADGRYDFRLDDGDMDLRVGEASGRFTFRFADGSLALDGGSGTAELVYDDGDARLTGTRFSRLSVQGGDGSLRLDGGLPAGAAYHVRLADGRADLLLDGVGGQVDVRFDDGEVRVDRAFSLIDEREHRATYQWGEGDAAVEVEVDDGEVELSLMR